MGHVGELCDKWSQIHDDKIKSHFPGAVEAHFDAAARTLVIKLTSGVSIIVPADLLQGLAGARDEQLRHVEISPSGLGLCFPDLDVDAYLPALLEQSFGTKRWMAARKPD